MPIHLWKIHFLANNFWHHTNIPACIWLNGNFLIQFILNMSSWIPSDRNELIEIYVHQVISLLPDVSRDNFCDLTQWLTFCVIVTPFGILVFYLPSTMLCVSGKNNRGMVDNLCAYCYIWVVIDMFGICKIGEWFFYKCFWICLFLYSREICLFTIRHHQKKDFD